MGPGDRVIISGTTREYREGEIKSWNNTLKRWDVRITLGPHKGEVHSYAEFRLSKIG